MSNTNGNCRTVSQWAAVVLGILGFLLAWKWLAWGVLISLIIGILVFFICLFVLVRVLCSDDSPAPVVSAPAPKPAAPAPKPEPAPTPAPTAAPAPAAEKPAATGGEDGKPAMLDGPRGGQADDLKSIKGVGPALEKNLNEMGVYHFDQVANWTAAEVAWVDDNLLRFKGRASRDNWIDQAKTLAAGGETEFSKRVEKGDVY